MFDVKLIVALLLALAAAALEIISANGVFVVPPGISATLTGIAGWLGLRRPGDQKAAPE